MTALHHAAEGGHPECVRALVEAGANTGARDAVRRMEYTRMMREEQASMPAAAAHNEVGPREGSERNHQLLLLCSGAARNDMRLWSPEFRSPIIGLMCLLPNPRACGCVSVPQEGMTPAELSDDDSIKRLLSATPDATLSGP